MEYFYVGIITYLKLARESTLSALHAFASSGQRFERIKATTFFLIFLTESEIKELKSKLI